MISGSYMLIWNWSDCSDVTYSDFHQLNAEKLKAYERQHRFPIDERFTFDQLLEYHTNQTSNILQIDAGKEVLQWMTEMLNELLYPLF